MVLERSFLDESKCRCSCTWVQYAACGSGKDSKLDSWFLFDLYKHKQNPVTKVQELVPEMSIFQIKHIKYCPEMLKNIYLCNILPIYNEMISKLSDFMIK